MSRFITTLKTEQIGKFDKKPSLRFISRWDVELGETLGFDDPVHGLLEVPSGFVSDLASIRLLREVCKWAALLMVILAVATKVGQQFTYITGTLITVSYYTAMVSLSLYALLVGYGMRAAILHDWLYTEAKLSRAECDAVFARALYTGDGTAKWRSYGLFYGGVRLFAASAYGKP